MTDYCTEAEFRAYIKDDTNQDDNSVAAAITSASRAVDAFCDRFFYTQAATINYFWPDLYHGGNPYTVCIDDLATTTSLAVDLDLAGNGTFTTSWTLNTHFVVEPVNRTAGGIVGVPYRELRSISGNRWPILLNLPWQEPPFPVVRVTGTWGWAAVPEPVTQATKVMAAMYYSMAGAPLGVAGIDAYGAMRVRDNPVAMNLLRPYALDPIAVG